MATENKTVNGNYGTHRPYGQAEPFIPSQGLNAPSGPVPAGSPGNETSSAQELTPSEPNAVNDGTKPPSKDEVGWYFVESYYTTLSKNPETLYV